MWGKGTFLHALTKKEGEIYGGLQHWVEVECALVRKTRY